MNHRAAVKNLPVAAMNHRAAVKSPHVAASHLVGAMTAAARHAAQAIAA